jgi:phytoene synthase
MSIDAADFPRPIAPTVEGWDHAGETANPLDAAYAVCRDITAYHSRSFSLAARLISPDKRPAIWALYAFCRTVDDAVDHAAGNIETTLTHWRRIIMTGVSSHADPVSLAWSDTLARRAIPRRYALELIDGVERDLCQTRYATFADLCSYCYGVASTVGLMSMHIIGFGRPEAVPYAVKLGIALQMTNILRDVGEDWERGRLYLPLEELAAFGLSERDIDAGVVTDAWRRFIDFQIARTRHLYQQAWPGIRMLDASGRLAIAAAATFYRGILDEIERNDYDVFTQRAHVSAWNKLRQLPGLWWQTRGAYDTTVGLTKQVGNL